MMNYDAGMYDVAVIGAGHAGIEAALAAARLGCKTVCFAVNLDSVGNMPCNPAIGGTAKGHLVREIDALGGEMGKAADASCIQYRMLNRRKGPAVHSLRAQADRREYQKYMKNALESQAGLCVVQGEATELVVSGDGRVSGVVTNVGGVYGAAAVVVATGTFLGGRVIIGECTYDSGPDGMFPAKSLAENLKALGLPMRRFKTGTPPRINADSVDFTKLELQPGEEGVVPFSFMTDTPRENRAACYLTYTTERTHEIIRENLSRSPLFSGKIEGVGPRYCPCIEDKVVRFADKPRHQLFVEPMGLGTRELYLQGFSSSMPAEVQEKMIRTVLGMENAHIQRYAYAIEYDCVDPQELTPWLETKTIRGLYGAGQFCGTSGYEEAAALGLVAGINAAMQCKGRERMILRRTDGYIGTLIDDIVTKGTNEPYRMMTARSENRLSHRQDNADLRLTPIGYRVGLAGEERLLRMEKKYAETEAELLRLENTPCVINEELQKYIAEKGSAPVKTNTRLAELVRRPELDYEGIGPADPTRPAVAPEVREQVEIRLKYDGYIAREAVKIEKQRKMEQRVLPQGLDYANIDGLRIEARQKLQRIQPASIGQASRISGVNPADITVLLIWLHHNAPNA